MFSLLFVPRVCVCVVSYECFALFCFVRYYLFNLVAVFSCSCFPSFLHLFCYPRASLASHFPHRTPFVVNLCVKGSWTFYNISFVWLIGVELLFIVLTCTLIFVFLYFGGQMWQSILKPKPQYVSQFPVQQSETPKCKGRVYRLDSASFMLDRKAVDDIFTNGCKWNAFHLDWIRFGYTTRNLMIVCVLLAAVTFLTSTW